MKKKKKTKKPDFENREPLFIFRNPKVKCVMDKNVFDQDDLKRVQNILYVMSRDIYIDKSYVDFAGTKYKDAFLTEEGWDSMAEISKEIAVGAKFGKTVMKNMDMAYRVVIQLYLLHVLEKYGYDSDHIVVTVDQEQPVDVEITPDVCEEWKYYGGDWRDR